MNTNTMQKTAVKTKLITLKGEVISTSFVFSQLKALGWDNATIRQVIQDLMKRHATTL